MLPRPPAQDRVNGALCHLEFSRQCRTAGARLMSGSNVAHDVSRQFAERVSFSPRATLRMESRTVPVPTGQTIRMQPRAIAIPASEAIRMQAGTVSVPTRHQIPMHSRWAQIASGGSALQRLITVVDGCRSEPQMTHARVGDSVYLVGADIVIAHASRRIACVADRKPRIRPVSRCQPPRIDMRADTTLVAGSEFPVAVLVPLAVPFPALRILGDFGPETVFGGQHTSGRLLRHRLSPSGGVTSPAVPPARGHFALNYTTQAAAEMNAAQTSADDLARIQVQPSAAVTGGR